MNMNRHLSSRETSNESHSVATAGEVHHTWAFAPASSSQSSGQRANVEFKALTNSKTVESTAPFSFCHSSRERLPQSLDEDGLLRARRYDSHKSTRLLDPSCDTAHTICRSESNAQFPTHILPQNSSGSFTSQDADGSTAQTQYSESRTSRVPDLKSSSRHQAFPIAPRYHIPTQPRKSLSERLQNEQPRPGTLRHATPLQHENFASIPVVKNESQMPVPAEEIDTSMTLDIDSIEVPVKSKTNSRSRSASVSSTAVDARGMQGVVMEAMKTIQRYESENEIQKGEIDRLNTHIALLEKEKEKLNNKVLLVKNTSLQKLATSSQNLEILRMDLVALKSDSKALTSCVSLSDVQEMKESLSSALRASAKYLEDHRPGDAENTREIVNELKLDCVNKQQVIDMLRDRLSDVLADLATSKNRVFELEDLYATDRLALKHATDQLATTGSRASELAFTLKLQQKESLDAMTLAGELDEKLHASKAEVSRLEQLVDEFKIKATDTASLENHISKLQSLVDGQMHKLETLDGLTNENIQLKSSTRERDIRVVALEGNISELNTVKERNAKLETLLEERERRQNLCDTELAKLLTLQDSTVLSNTQLKTQLQDCISKSKLLESELLTKSQHLDELRTLMGGLQANFDTSCQSVRTLEAELASSWAREAASRAAEASEKAQRVEESRQKTANAQQLMAVERKLQEQADKVAMQQKRAEEAEARFQSMQERFEEQSITLRLTRDTSAELQDRILAAKSGYAKDLEANCGSLRTQIAVLQEQNTTLQSQLQQCRDDAQGKYQEYKTKEALLMQRIEDAEKDGEVKRGDLRAKIAVLQEQKTACQVQLKENASNAHTLREESVKKETELLLRIDDARKELDREVRRASELKVYSDRELSEAIRRSKDLESRLVSVQERLETVPSPCTVHTEEIERLTAHVSRINAQCDAMKERASSINYRYDNGDLEAEERILIKTIIDATQSERDQELAQVQNELKRSNKLVSSLQDAKVALENSLAKHLAAEATLKSAAARAGNSVMELVNWPSSPHDISMEDCVPPAQDRDEPSTAPDEPNGEEESKGLLPAFDPIRVPDSPDRPLASIMRFSTPASANRNFVRPVKGLPKPYFSSLATDQSDEIVEFDEETIGTKRKKMQFAQAEKAEASKPAKKTKTTQVSENPAEGVVESGTTKTTYKSKRKRR